MKSHSLLVLASIASLATLVFSLVASSPNGHSGQLSRRQQTPWSAPPRDPDDFQFIKKWAAIGDSYAAGIGSGKVLNGPQDANCSRYDNSYPSFINNNVQFGYGHDRKFQYLACSGQTSPEAEHDQVPNLESDLEFVTLSSGGNDVGLSDLLDACVFQWSIPGSTAKCEAQLRKTEDLISNTLAGNLDQLYAAVKPKLASGAKTYVTGYAKFFDTTTTACDSVSWAFFYADQKQKLTTARRQKMNDLVDSANKVIKAAVGRAGNKFEFVDYDQYFSLLEGSFCWPSVQEPDPTRDETLFFQWDSSSTLDSLTKRDSSLTPDGNFLEERATTEQPSAATLTEGTEEYQINAWIQEGLANSDNNTSNATKVNNFGVTHPGVQLSIIPDHYAKAFHPTPQGHAIIAKLVMWRLSQDRSRTLGIDTVEEIDPPSKVCLPDSGPPTTATPAAATTAAAPSGTPTCVNSQQVYTQSVDVVSPKDKDAITVYIPIADHIGDWSLNFGHTLPGGTDEISNWEVAATIVGRSTVWPLSSGSTPPTSVKWSKDATTEKTFIDFEFKSIATQSFNFIITGFISPSKDDGTIDCATRDDGAGTDTTSTFWTSGSIIVQGQALSANSQICTTDTSKCIANGQSTDGNTPGTIYSNWCLIYSSGKTGFVIADLYTDFGAPGSSCINGAQMTRLGVWAANNCAGSDKVVDVAGQGAKGDGSGVSNNGQWQQTLCIVNTDHPEVCIS